jgi:hypothetical protein
MPIITWLDSFHKFQWIETLLKNLNASPTPPANVIVGKVVVDRRITDGNLGFFIEALVYALPQGLLQTFILVASRKPASWLLVSSIFFNVFAVVSKSYILAFSVHGPTFLFNTLAITSDVAGLFALFFWSVPGSFLVPIELVKVSLGLVYTMVLCVVLYVRTEQAKSSSFTNWLVRCFTASLVGAAFVVFPVVMLLAWIRAVLVPLVWLKTMNFNHMTYPQVNKKLVQYLSVDPDQRRERISELNACLVALSTDNHLLARLSTNDSLVHLVKRHLTINLGLPNFYKIPNLIADDEDRFPFTSILGQSKKLLDETWNNRRGQFDSLRLAQIGAVCIGVFLV